MKNVLFEFKSNFLVHCALMATKKVALSICLCRRGKYYAFLKVIHQPCTEVIKKCPHEPLSAHYHFVEGEIPGDRNHDQLRRPWQAKVLRQDTGLRGRCKRSGETFAPHDHYMHIATNRNVKKIHTASVESAEFRMTCWRNS